MTILIVDDVVTDGMLLSALIADESDDVITLDCPTDGLSVAESHSPFLVVVDYSMPELDGIEFIRRLRRLDKHQSTPVLMVTAANDREIRLAAIEAGATDFLVKPVDPLELRARIRNLMALTGAHRSLAARVSSLVREVARGQEALAEREGEIVVRLSRAASCRDREPDDHNQRAALLAQSIARILGFDQPFCLKMYFAMQLHDIGKLGVSELILEKSGPLTPEERARMELHVLIGAQILAGSSSELVKLGEEVAVTHHERWNGSGYPLGLCGEAIPISGRIAAVADVYDALTSLRSYKAAWSSDSAVAYMRSEAGKLFDPVCVTALIDFLDEA